MSLRPMRGRKRVILIVWACFGTLLFIHEFTNRPIVQEGFKKLQEQNLWIGKKAEFISNILQDDAEEPYDGSGLNELCRSKRWQQGLTFTCDNLYGGIGNVRNTALNCIRFAIEAGAALVIPAFERRSQSNLLEWSTGSTDMSDWFDRPHFISKLVTDCPQMELIEATDLLFSSPNLTTLKFNPRGWLKGDDDLFRDHTIEHPEEWRPLFDDWLRNEISSPVSDKNPVLIHLKRSIFAWRLTHHSEVFFHNFGRILRIRPDIRRLAATVLYSLSTRFSVPMDLSQYIIPNAFLGAHLRTEQDAIEAGYPGYDYVADNYIKQAVTHSLPVIYVASGIQKDADRLGVKAYEEQRYNVTTKYDLLTGEDRTHMEEFTFDQQALIDYEVLQRSTSFAGMALSTFSWQIAMKRHFAAGSRRADFVNGVHGQTLDDEFSWVYGDVFHWDMIGVSMWP